MKIRRWMLGFLCVLFSPAVSLAGDQFGGFRQYVNRDSLKPFARDLGALMGAATFHNGRPLGFSGFDVGVRGGMMLLPDARDKVLRDKGVRAYGLPWVQAEIGLPKGLDGYIRGISYQGLTIAGGGLRYGLTKAQDKPLKPQFLIAASAHSLAHRYFSASHFGGDLIGSIMVKGVTFYSGAGVDRTRVVVRTVPVRDAGLEGESAAALGSRFTTGVSLRPLKYLYLHAAYMLVDKQSGFSCGFGIRF